MHPLSRPGVTQENLKAFIGNNADKIIRRGSNDISWCWPGFFFSVFWLAYRKAYLAALILLLIDLALQVLTIPYFAAEFNGGSVHMHLVFPALLINALVGLFGLRYYLNFASKKVERINAETADPALRQTFYQSKGGTSVASMLGFFIVASIIHGSVWVSMGGVEMMHQVEMQKHQMMIQSATVQNDDNSQTTTVTIKNTGGTIQSSITTQTNS